MTVLIYTRRTREQTARTYTSKKQGTYVRKHPREELCQIVYQWDKDRHVEIVHGNSCSPSLAARSFPPFLLRREEASFLLGSHPRSLRRTVQTALWPRPCVSWGNPQMLRCENQTHLKTRSIPRPTPRA